MRLLKHHEKRLLKKTDFLEWKRDQNTREVRVLRRYGIQDREDYHKYNKLCGLITSLVSQLRLLPSDDEARLRMIAALSAKLAQIGVAKKNAALPDFENLSASSFCRRRLSVVLVRLHFAEDLDHAISLIEQGHIRIGPDLITDPATHVTIEMEDHLTWAEGSSIKRKIREFHNERDDYELMRC